MPKKNKMMNRGAAIASICFALFFFIILVRFMYIQITGTVDGQVLAVKANEQYQSKKNLEAKRGSILDRNGNVIAEDTSVYKLIAIMSDKMTVDPKKPMHVVDKEKTAKELSKVIDMSESEILRRLNTKDAFQVEFGKAGKDISYSTKEKIEKLELPGIAFEKDTKRYYPNGMFASNLIGYARLDEATKDMTGAMGLEKTLNKYLKEKDGYVTFNSDKSGWALPNSKEDIVAPKNGNNVTLTIDQKIQAFLEESMTQVANKYKPKKIIATVVDPKTGKVLAMGQRPSFNLNELDITNYNNDVISYAFEPGSTMKIFTLAAAIEEGVYQGKSEKFQSGTYKVGGGLVRDHNGGNGWGKIDYHEGVLRSSNVVFAKLAKEKLGFNRYEQYLKKFNFYDKTGIDLPNEASSKINYRYEYDKASTAYGQASAVTPIQQIQAATAIANGGSMMKPYVIDRITDPSTNKTILQHEPTVAGKPISADTAKEVRDILGEVVSSKIGTGQPYQIKGFDVAGKTGTGQIGGAGGYLQGRNNYVFSFMGMAPKDDPKLLVYVAVQQPQLSETETGSAPVSQIFNPVMKNSLLYLNIAPTKTDDKKSDKQKVKQEAMPSLLDLEVKQAEAEARNKKLNPIVIGDGLSVKRQWPNAGSDFSENQKVFLKTAGKTIKMPDMKGWSRREVLQFASISGARIETKGQGYAVKQSVKSGAKISDKVITVTFKSPS
ncbi:penicillin-binding protein [Bacillus sp. 179-C3.3 HS]|uniref:penicillin-binding protein n=1 Tax=Bacillus sp. 179-C3.3 HS TaxID=3232162 RepID=UPI0039A36D0C